MPWDDEKLGEAVREAYERDRSTAPGFDLMWREASSVSRGPSRVVWAAAGIVLSIGLVASLYGRVEESTLATDATTRSPLVAVELVDEQEEETVDEWTLASWEVPTDVLLTEEAMDDAWGEDFYEDRIDELMEL